MQAVMVFILLTKLSLPALPPRTFRRQVGCQGALAFLILLLCAALPTICKTKGGNGRKIYGEYRWPRPQ